MFACRYHVVVFVSADRIWGSTAIESSTQLSMCLEATVSDLVSCKRSFTVEQMRIVGKVFALPAVVFMERATRN
jgi:hypothetical protein